ncbi:hypothetical protein EP837_03067 [Sphingobium sp. EP60837]|nr:hypothetical protein EP837_03067 [Sphingobium sp. EP60837]
MSGDEALDAGFPFDLGGIDGGGSVGELGNGYGRVVEEDEAGVDIAAAHDVEEVEGDTDVAAAGLVDFAEGFAEGLDLGGWIKFDGERDAISCGELGQFDEPFGATDRIAIVAKDVGEGGAQGCAGLERGGERGVGTLPQYRPNPAQHHLRTSPRYATQT